ncbi:hypothetical protein JCM12107_21500 [Corynebacterium simulans]
MTTLNPRKKRRAFLTGLGSVLDLNGQTTYRRAQKLLPTPAPRRNMNEALLLASAQMSLEKTGFHPRK